MTNKRDRRQTPTDTSIVCSKQKSLFDDYGLTDAVPLEDTELKADTSSAFYLNGEGTSKDTARIISCKVSKKNNYRVPVLNPDGTPAMPTKAVRANKWIKEGKARVVKNKLNIFQIQLLFEPSGKNKQDVVMSVDPGSTFTGIAVGSKCAVLYGCTLELPGYKKDNKPSIVENEKGKKIEKYHNIIIDRMNKRRELRKNRRQRKTRKRPARWLNRSKSKIPPSIIARKQLELKVVKGLFEIYPIIKIGFEDIAFNHWKDTKGTKGRFFSHVETGKRWIITKLKEIAELKVIKGYETSRMRTQLRLSKESDKTKRTIEAHVNDCLAMNSILLGAGIERNNKFKYDTMTRPKYSRRALYLEQFSKGNIKRKYGGTTIEWSKLRKGDYVEIRENVMNGYNIYRGWISGYHESRRLVSVSDFDWNRIVQIAMNKVRLLSRNNNLLLESMNIRKDESKFIKNQASIFDY